MKKIEIDHEKLRELVEQDVQNWKIAEHFGCSRGTIEKHMRLLNLKKARTGPKAAERHPDWKGGVTIRKGYRYLYRPDHPNAINGRYVAEHRLVMEEKLGRLLDRTEVVHHIDGNLLNNDLDNLELYADNGTHLLEHFLGNEKHAEKIRQAMNRPDVKEKRDLRWSEYHQEKQNRLLSEPDDSSETQTSDHQT